ncbi:serine hydrolase domain-containing protein [Leifsonia sp. AG29]|uniref:serine hydrolase domain-containing protein n=1 Tax=Leifsonia sp. AG29 TaxID=2598860 RepID=UPI00131DA72D|nr:serine hydrolase domain-containing protein [Leifsonia sp. AG29]
MTDLARHAQRLLDLRAGAGSPAGAVIGVRSSGAAEVEAAGWAVLPQGSEPGVPMSSDMQLDLASVTKVAATTAGIMRLVDSGQVSLEDRVTAFLPEFRGGAKDSVALAHLLTHTAGLEPWWPVYLETEDRDQAILRVQRLPLADAPGTVRRYSDLGFMLAGAIVERVSGLPLRRAYRELIADPLGLSSRFGPVAPESAAVSADSDAYEYSMVLTGTPYPVPFEVGAYPHWRDRALRGEPNDGNAAHAFDGAAGHAGLFSTVDDLLALGAELRGGDFVSERVLDQFSAPSAIDPSQAIGFRLTSIEHEGRAVTALGHGGFTGTWFGFGLEHDIVVAGGATRLHGTVGGIDAATAAHRPPDLVPGDAIERVLLDAGADALATLHPSTTNAEDL